MKKSDKLEEYCPNPYSFKFEVAACDRPSFANEAEKISAIKLLSNDLLTFYQNMHLKSEKLVPYKVPVSDAFRNSTSVSVITPNKAVEAIKMKSGRKVFSSSKLKKVVKCLRRTIQRNRIKIFNLENQVSSKNVTDEGCSDTNDTSEI